MSTYWSGAVLWLAGGRSTSPRVAKPRHKGFGTRLLERALASDLGGRVDLDFQPSGLLCRMRGPLARISPAD